SLPGGFAAPTAFVDYHNANGTLVVLYNGAATQYRAMPAAGVGSGDFYHYSIAASDIATHNSLVGFLQTTSSGGGPFSATLPQPWSSFSPPAPAAFPSFTFNYAGFNGLPGVSQEATLTWIAGSTVSGIIVVATSSFQNGATTLAIPNLTSLPGFIAPPASGTS